MALSHYINLEEDSQCTEIDLDYLLSSVSLLSPRDFVVWLLISY